MHVVDVLPQDAIKSLDDPRFDTDDWGTPDDQVLVIETQPARAYPLRMLGGHEIVNDDVNGRPIAVTWCPICWSAAVYDRRIRGRTLTFGVSGKLADDALVMYDRETGSEWRQPTGEAIAGEFVGERLVLLSAPTMSWGRFREEWPDGLVLQPNGADSPAAARRRYDMQRYREYRAAEEFGLFGMRGEGRPREWNRTDIDAKTVVLGIEIGGEAMAVPEPVVAGSDGMVETSLGGTALIVVLAGNTLHAYVHPGTPIEYVDGALRFDRAVWDVTTGQAPGAEPLERVPSRPMFAFAWQDAHGPDSFYGLDG